MQNIGLLILRVVPAVIMLIAHGWGKFSSYTDMMHQFPDPIGLGSPVAMALAIFAEFFCSILLVLGIGTRIAAIPLLITMMVAGLIIHAQDPWAKQEFPFLYATIFLTLIFTGGGTIGLGHKLFKNPWLRT